MTQAKATIALYEKRDGQPAAREAIARHLESLCRSVFSASSHGSSRAYRESFIDAAIEYAEYLGEDVSRNIVEKVLEQVEANAANATGRQRLLTNLALTGREANITSYLQRQRSVPGDEPQTPQSESVKTAATSIVAPSLSSVVLVGYASSGSLRALARGDVSNAAIVSLADAHFASELGHDVPVFVHAQSAGVLQSEMSPHAQLQKLMAQRDELVETVSRLRDELGHAHQLIEDLRLEQPSK